MARWWAGALGWRITYEDADEVVVERTDGRPNDEIALLFIKVADSKVVKNRLHLDLRPDDRDAEVARLQAMEAKRIDIGQAFAGFQKYLYQDVA